MNMSSRNLVDDSPHASSWMRHDIGCQRIVDLAMCSKSASEGQGVGKKNGQRQPLHCQDCRCEQTLHLMYCCTIRKAGRTVTFPRMCSCVI